jgi:SAM-dependent methyltransferase
MKALDVGSGHNPVQKSGWYKPGDLDNLTFTNMDAFHPTADVKHSFEDLPWPFPDNEFAQVFARHTLEHVRHDKLLDVMREIHRVSKDNAHVFIRVPYWNSEAFAGDPTHWNPFCETTFQHMCYGGSLNTEFYMPVLFRMVDMEFKFQPKFRFLPKRVLKELMHLLCGVCDEMWVTMQVVKNSPPADGLIKYSPHRKYSFVKPEGVKPWMMAALYGELFYGSMVFVAAGVFRLSLAVTSFSLILFGLGWLTGAFIGWLYSRRKHR